MKKKNLATAMAAAMMFGGVAPVVAHAAEEPKDSVEAPKEGAVVNAEDKEINVALANKEEVKTTKNYRDIYNTKFTATTKDDVIKDGYVVLHQDKAVGEKTPEDGAMNFIYTTKMEKATAESTAESVKLENAQNNIKFLVDKGYYTKAEEEAKLNNDGKDLSKATIKTVTLTRTKAGEESGRQDKTIVYNFYNTPVEFKQEVVINIAWPANNKIELAKDGGQVVELNKFAYSLNCNADNIVVDKSEKGTGLQLDVYQKDKDGKKDTNKKLGTVILENFEDFKTGGYKGYAEIPAQNDFDNKSYNTWATADILDAMANGKIDASAEFRPEDSVTRAEFAKILMNSMPGVKKDATKEDLKITKSFKDVDKAEWYYEYVMPLAELGIVSGFDGEFRPNDTITREEAAVMVSTAMNKNAENGKYVKADTFYTHTGQHKDVKTKFTDDKSIAVWADEAVVKASDAGIIKGYEDGKDKFSFKPQNNITRAESVVMLTRAGK